MDEQYMLKRYVEAISLKINTRVEQLTWALHELDRMTCFLFGATPNEDELIDQWLRDEAYIVDEDGFYQSRTQLEAFRRGELLPNGISCSWGKHLQFDSDVRFRQYALRNMGHTLFDLHKRFPFAAWIYYQDISNTAIQYPFIDQRAAITWDFNWHEYHTYISVSPENNPERAIKWTQPSIDYAGEGLIISVSKPVYIKPRKDAFVGLWSIDVPLRNLYADYIGSPLFASQETFIIDSTRQFISHPRIPAMIGKKEGSIFRESIDMLGDGFAELTFQGLKEKEDTPFDVWNNQAALVVSSSTIPSLDWLVLSAVPKQILLDAVSERMKGVIRNIQAGDLSTSVQIDNLPEHWQSLVDALNDMTRSLQEAHRREQHLNAVIGSVRKINQLIVAERSADALIQTACNILIETRDYRHAWIGLRSADGRFDQVMESGFESGLPRLRKFLAEPKPPQYIQQAMSQNRIVLTRADEAMRDNCPISERFPDADKLTVRLSNDDFIYGVLSITVQLQTIDDEELTLINQLAGDLCVALRSIALHQEQQRTADELRTLNDELEQRVEERTLALQVANEELEAFSYSVSHDLRAPLRAISGFSTVLLDDYQDKLDAEGRNSLERIVSGTERMSKLIDDLLRLSRVSRSKLRFSEVDLSAMAAEIVEALRRGEPDREVDIRVCPDLKTYGDPTLLYVVLQNLLDNAWKYTSSTPLPHIEWGWDDTMEGGAYFVRDNGAGFDMAFAGKLFEAFQRIHSDDQYPGSGIGLAAAARAVHRHGGRIWGEGEVGQGAVFGFTLNERRASRPPVMEDSNR